METFQRCLNIVEWEQIRERLLFLRDKEGSKLMQYANADKAVKSLVELSFFNKVVEFYDNGKFIGIVAFDVGSLWWTKEKILSELLILCMSDKFKGFNRIAIDKLHELAKKYEAKIICSGCMFQKEPQIVTNCYLKKGFNLSLPTYVKFLES